MKIIGLRAARFRRFSDPIALEGFADGVNVIAGANETGKSTLFHALEAAFLTPHSKTGAALEFLRPHGGGEPLVEADFETGGKRYRIRKQFGRGKAAVLKDLATGKVLARAADAEEMLGNLIGVSSEGPGRAGLVWVRQRRALMAPDPDLDPETGKPRPRGERNALTAALGDDIVEAAGSQAAEAVMAKVAAVLGDFITAGRAEARKNGPYDLALRTRAKAGESLAKARLAAAASEARFTKIAGLTAALAASQAQPGDGDGKIAEGERALAEAAEKRVRRDQLMSERDARRLEAENARQALDASNMVAARTNEMAARLETARSLEAEVQAHSAALNQDAATPARLKRLDDIERAMAVSEAQMSGPGARVDLALTPEGARKVTADGAPAATRYDVTEQLTIAVDGIGTIRITSAGAERAAAARARHEEARNALAACLGEMAAPDSATARARGEARQNRLAALEDARARLSMLAPKGAAGLAGDLAALGTPGDAAAKVTLQQRAEDMALAAAAAARAYEEARAAAPDDAALRKLSADVAALKSASRARAEEVRRMSLELERLKGEQAGFDEDGRAQDQIRDEGELERADREVKRIEEEIAALRLLNATLKSTTDGIKSRYFDPVARAIAPYLVHLFPDAAIDLEEGFSLRALTRAGEREDFAVLSDGTREQLAVLVRMGFARVLADRGMPVPLVLDDPLVYSDDERLAAMCRALEDAGRVHQVVLLTCRQSAFQKLAGRRLTLENWRPDGDQI